jgi:hypothetical protein
MAALEASVAAAKQARKRHPTGRDADDVEDGDEVEDEVAAKKTARRSKKSA